MAENTAARDGLVGNRWVLIGGDRLPAGVGGDHLGRAPSVWARRDPRTDSMTWLDAYAGPRRRRRDHGRLVRGGAAGTDPVFIGLRHALAESGYRHPLLDLAVAAAAVSVTLEVASYGLGRGGRRTSGGMAKPPRPCCSTRPAAGLNLMILGGLGVAVAATSWCMWRSGLFSTACSASLAWPQALAMIGGQLMVAPSRQTIFDVLSSHSSGRSGSG